ncbi:unnamed protein product [Anisakis simplex]|uniref:Uncharacterized protein n=1 Tax=Anisakis simplex TaxID=6269 RepID=A0A0M3K8P4_ANISI|nr:unnamed protein product [Anisakis simplex]
MWKKARYLRKLPPSWIMLNRLLQTLKVPYRIVQMQPLNDSGDRANARLYQQNAANDNQNHKMFMETKDNRMEDDKYGMDRVAESTVDKTQEASCSEVVEADSPKASQSSQSSSCYEQESLLITPLRELLDAEDSNSNQGPSYDTGKDASGSALDVVEGNPSKETFRADALGSKSGLDGSANWNLETPSRRVIDHLMVVGSETRRCRSDAEEHHEDPFETPKKV